MQLVQTLMCLALPQSVATRTVLRLGSQRRRVLLLAWLTLLPVEGFLPHKSHILDMVNSLVLIQMRKFDYILSIQQIGKGFSCPSWTLFVRQTAWHMSLRWRVVMAFLSMVLVAFPPSFVAAREIVSVDQHTVINDNFQGLNAVYHAFSYLPESLEMGMTAELRALELARVKGSGIRIARTMYRPDWAMGEGPWLKADWNSVKMRALYAWIADLQTMGVEVALNVGWWFPRDVIWNRDQHFALYPADLQNYCQWVSESLHQIVEVRGLTNLKYIVLFTEPSDPYGDTPQRKTPWEYYKKTLQSVQQRLVDDGRRSLVKMVAPNAVQSAPWLEQATKELDDVIDIYSAHSYQCRTYQEWYAMAQAVKTVVAPTGKPFWIDEYGVQDEGLRQTAAYGVTLAQANAAFLNAGAQASFLWAFNDQYHPSPIQYYTSADSFRDGLHRWGLFRWLPESRAIRPAGQAFVLLARALGQAGGKVVRTEASGGLAAAAIVPKEGGLVLLLVNGGGTKQDVEAQFAKPLSQGLLRAAYHPGGGSLVDSSWQPLAVLEGGRAMHDELGAGEVVIYRSQGALSASDADSLAVGQGGAGGVMPEAWRLTDEGLNNLAFQKKVEASSSEPDWPAANLTDGQRLTSWCSLGKKRSQTEWLKVDLGQVYQVQAVEVFPGYGGETVGRIAPRLLSLTLSVDGKKWCSIPIPEARGGGGLKERISFPPQPARYLRLDSSGKRQGEGKKLFRVRCGEVKVWGR